MKKFFYLIFCISLFTLCTGFCSCSNDDEEDELQTAIIGKWKISEVKTSSTGSYSRWVLEETTATFTSQGSYIGRGYFGYGSGTYSIKGNVIKTYVDNMPYATYKVLNYTSNTAEMEMTGLNNSIWIKCTRVY